jgi:hypothetical protein
MTRRSYFRAYLHKDPRPGCTEPSHTYFRIARDLQKSMDRDGNNAFPAIVFYVSAVESFINEKLNLTSFLMGCQNFSESDIAQVREIMEKSISRDKIKSCLNIYTRDENLAMDFSQDFIDLLGVRHEIIHYVPNLDIHMNQWPNRVGQAIRKSDVQPGRPYSLWDQAIRTVKFVEWCYSTAKKFLSEFCDLTGMTSPFDLPEPFRWE